MKQTIFILHGWSTHGQSEAKWQPCCTALNELGFTTKVLAIPGLSAPLQEVWGLSEYVQWLDGELAQEKNVILLGHSFGGQLASRYVSQHPGKVAKLILLDSSGVRDHSLKATLKRAGFYWIAKMGGRLSHDERVRRVLYRFAGASDYQEASPLLRKTMAKVLQDEVGSDVEKIDIPTLILWGSDDRVTPLWIAKFFHQKIRQSYLKIIDGGRHSPQYTHPEKIAQEVADFLGKQKE